MLFCLIFYEPSALIYKPSFAKTNPKRSFSVIENERFGLVFAKTGSIISGKGSIPSLAESIRSGLPSLDVGCYSFPRSLSSLFCVFYASQAHTVQILPFAAQCPASFARFLTSQPSLTCWLHYFYFMILPLRLLYSIHSPS